MHFLTILSKKLYFVNDLMFFVDSLMKCLTLHQLLKFKLIIKKL